MITYSTNWMGPVTLSWYRERGLLAENCIEPTTEYSAGRIDIYGVPGEHFALEYGLDPMHSEDWNALSKWLDDVETKELLPYDELIQHFEEDYGKKIRWAEQ